MSKERIVDEDGFTTCNICGKKFIPGMSHMYKRKDKRGRIKKQCSYTCYRKAGGDPN